MTAVRNMLRHLLGPRRAQRRSKRWVLVSAANHVPMALRQHMYYLHLHLHLHICTRPRSSLPYHLADRGAAGRFGRDMAAGTIGKPVRRTGGLRGARASRWSQRSHWYAIGRGVAVGLIIPDQGTQLFVTIYGVVTYLHMNIRFRWRGRW